LDNDALLESSEAIMRMQSAQWQGKVANKGLGRRSRSGAGQLATGAEGRKSEFRDRVYFGGKDPEGFEPSAATTQPGNSLRQTSTPSAVAGAASRSSFDSELAFVIREWARLPAAVRGSIVAVVRSQRPLMASCANVRGLNRSGKAKGKKGLHGREQDLACCFFDGFGLLRSPKGFSSHHVGATGHR
jgi:hypothetical protein